MLFNNDKNLENANEFILQLQDRVIRHNTTIRQIDDRGSFESDDEVGFFFEELKKMIEDISNYFASNTTIESDVFDDVD